MIIQIDPISIVFKVYRGMKIKKHTWKDVYTLSYSSFSLLTEAQIAERKAREYQEKEHDIACARELVNICTLFDLLLWFFNVICTVVQN